MHVADIPPAKGRNKVGKIRQQPRDRDYLYTMQWMAKVKGTGHSDTSLII